MAVRVEPLCYVAMTTDKGPMTMAFYYDVAPITVENFLSLSAGGFYDGLTFHRIVPNFIIEGGDPRGDRTGGPGYHIEAEFNDRPHQPGVISMAHSTDPNEAGGAHARALNSPTPPAASSSSASTTKTPSNSITATLPSAKCR